MQYFSTRDATIARMKNHMHILNIYFRNTIHNKFNILGRTSNQFNVEFTIPCSLYLSTLWNFSTQLYIQNVPHAHIWYRVSLHIAVLRRQDSGRGRNNGL